MKRIAFIAEIQTSDKSFARITEEYTNLTKGTYTNLEEFKQAYLELLENTLDSFYVDIVQLTAIDSTPKTEEPKAEVIEDESKKE